MAPALVAYSSCPEEAAWGWPAAGGICDCDERTSSAAGLSRVTLRKLIHRGPVLNPTVSAVIAALGILASEQKPLILSRVQLHRVSRTISGTLVVEQGVARIQFDEQKATFVDIRMPDEHATLLQEAPARVRVRGTAHVDSQGVIHRFDVARAVKLHEPPGPVLPPDELFEQMAIEEPQRLLTLIESASVSAYLLSYAAESAGRHLSGERCLKALVSLLEHDEPIVREGALYGLAFRGEEAITDLIRHHASNDASPGVRRAAVEVLKRR